MSQTDRTQSGKDVTIEIEGVNGLGDSCDSELMFSQKIHHRDSETRDPTTKIVMKSL